MADDDRYHAGQVRNELAHDDDNPRCTWNDDDGCPRSGVISLPHQCSSWTIGGREEVLKLIADLQAIIAEIPE